MALYYPYPKKARLKIKDYYLDGGTKQYEVLNINEIGISYVYQDYRLGHNTSHGKFYTAYPDNPDAQEIIPNFLIIENE